METKEQIAAIEESAKSILGDKNIRLVRVINRMGRIIVEKYQDGVTSLLVDNEDKMISMQLALEIFLRDEFDEKLGPIDYVLSKRRKINLISIPIQKYLVLVSTEPNSDVEDVVKKTSQSLDDILK